MTQFKDCISEELCFQSLYTQLCLSPWHRKSRFHKQSDLQRLCLLWTPPPRQVPMVPFFFFHLAISTLEECDQPTCRHVCICSFLLCPTTCSFPAGWHSARAHTSHRPCLWLLHNEPPLPRPSPSPAQQDPWRQEAHMEFKSEDRGQIRLTAPTPQK